MILLLILMGDYKEFLLKLVEILDQKVKLMKLCLKIVVELAVDK